MNPPDYLKAGLSAEADFIVDLREFEQRFGVREGVLA